MSSTTIRSENTQKNISKNVQYLENGDISQVIWGEKIENPKGMCSYPNKYNILDQKKIKFKNEKEKELYLYCYYTRNLVDILETIDVLKEYKLVSNTELNRIMKRYKKLALKDTLFYEDSFLSNLSIEGYSDKIKEEFKREKNNYNLEEYFGK
jgi:hypothetical protein